MDKLIFIDTNIFLDFYRLPQSDTSTTFLKVIDENHENIIATEQVAMEYKKNRVNVLKSSYRELKNSELSNLTIPPIIIDDEFAQKIKLLKNSVKEEYVKLKKRLTRLLKNQGRMTLFSKLLKSYLPIHQLILIFTNSILHLRK